MLFRSPFGRVPAPTAPLALPFWRDQGYVPSRRRTRVSRLALLAILSLQALALLSAHSAQRRYTLWPGTGMWDLAAISLAVDEVLLPPAARKPEQLASGPGKLTLALGITRALNGADVTRGVLVVREPAEVRHVDIAVTPRIGITQSADLPLRFIVRHSPFVSR